MTVRLGTRGSELARRQTGRLERGLREQDPDLRVETRVLETTGDRVRDVPLARIGDKGLFTKQIDRAVLDGEVDAAVHSLKDVPTDLDERLALRTVFAREDPRDVVLFAPGRPTSLSELPAGARVGTSSLRRRALLRATRADLTIDDLRGNLDTRLQRIADADYDAAVLAFAGLRRLGRVDAVGQVLEPPEWLPAAGQGALAVTLRRGDERMRRLLDPLEHEPTRAATVAERSFLGTLEGGCQIPIGALGEPIEGGGLELHGFVASLDGRTVLRETDRASSADTAELGRRLARTLLGRGAADVLRDARARAAESPPEASAP